MRTRRLKLHRIGAVASALALVAACFSMAGSASAEAPDAGASPPRDGRDARDAGASRDAAGAPAAGPSAGRDAGTPISRIPPDPPAMSEREQWVFDLRWDRGEVYLLAVHKQDMGAPHPTPRVMGRFALELFEGPTLIERVRFDFPMLGAPEPPDAGMKTPPRFEAKLKTRIGVFFPATKRGTRLELWDRAKDVRWPLAWPPKEGVVMPPSEPPSDGTKASPADAGAR